MSDCISEGGVAEIYVETFRLNGGDEREVQGGSQGRTVQDQTRRDIEKRLSFYPPPSENDKDGEGGTESEDEEYMEEEECTSDEEEFDDTSDEDEEANQFKMNARRQGENPAGNATDYGFSDLLLQEILEEAQTLQDDDEPLVIDSSEEYNYEDDDRGEAIRRRSRFGRFDTEATIPSFSLGMIFSGRDQFKKALIKYGLATRRHLVFPKDEAT